MWRMAHLAGDALELLRRRIIVLTTVACVPLLVLSVVEGQAVGGVALPFLYDIELHTTMYETYHPGAVVRWDELKTRGDYLCKFRISIPELMSPNDPEYPRQ